MQTVVAIVTEQYRILGFVVDDIAVLVATDLNDFLTGDAFDLCLVKPPFDANLRQAGGSPNQAVM
jgi:hypothetical protein